MTETTKGLPDYDRFGYALAMRVMQSGLYHKLDDLERAECDALINAVLKPAPSIAGKPNAVPQETRAGEGPIAEAIVALTTIAEIFENAPEDVTVGRRASQAYDMRCVARGVLPALHMALQSIAEPGLTKEVPLEPCPFCGKPPERAQNSDAVRCPNHAPWMPLFEWNRRAPSIAGKPHKGLDDQLRDRLLEYEAALQESVNEGGEEAEAQLEAKRTALLEMMRSIREAALHSAASEQQPGDSTVLRSERPTEHPGDDDGRTV